MAIIRIPAAKGLNLGGDARLQPPDEPRSLSNVTFDRDQGWSPRPGITSMPSVGPLDAVRLGTRRDELLAIDGEKQWAYSPALSQWVAGDRVSRWSTRRRSVFAGTQVLTLDVGVGGGLEVYVYSVADASTTNASTRATVIDATSGTALLANVELSSNTANSYVDVRVVFSGSYAHAIYRQSGTNTLYWRRLTLASPLSGWTAAAALADACDAISGWDACAGFGAGEFAVYGRDPTSGQPRFTLYSSAGAMVRSRTMGIAIGGGPYGIQQHAAAAGNGFWLVAGIGAADVNVRFIDQATLLDVTALNCLVAVGAALNVSVVGINTTEAVVVATYGGGATTRDYLAYEVVSTAGVLSGLRGRHSMGAASKVFVRGGEAFMLAAFSPWQLAGSSTQESAWLVSLETWSRAAAPPSPRIVASVAPRTMKRIATAAYECMGNVAPAGADAWVAAAAVRLTVETYTDRPVTSVTRIGISADTRHVDAMGALGDHGLICCGVPSYYDGRRVAEMGFAWEPDQPSRALVAGGGALSAGSYRYVWVFEHRDAAGVIHRSAPSAPSDALVVAANDRIDVTGRYMTMTNRQIWGETPVRGPVALVLYRTKVGGLAPYYRVTPEDPPYSVMNDLVSAAGTIAIRDGLADSALGALLYTTGGVLDNVSPPSAIAMVVHRNRVFLAADDGRTIWASKAYVPGEAPGFNEALTFSLDDDGRDVTALGSLDDKLVVFKSSAIYVVSGDGPNDLGMGSDWSPPQRVSSDTGCTDPRSVVSCPLGVMFRGHQGIYLLSRGLEVVFIGSDVQALTDAFPVVTSAVCVPEASHVRFTLQDSERHDYGTVLVFDYRLRRWAAWSVLEGHQDTTAALSGGPQTACWHPTYGHVLGWNNTAVDSEPVFRRVDPAQTGDDHTAAGARTAPEIVFETPWVPVGEGLAGQGELQAVRVVGERLGAHRVDVRLSYDYDAAVYEDYAFSAADVTTVGTAEVLRVVPLRRRCSAVSVRVVAVPSGSAAGMSLAEIQLEVAPLAGGVQTIQSVARR